MDVALTYVNCFLWRILLHLAYVNHIQNFPHEMFSTLVMSCAQCQMWCPEPIPSSPQFSTFAAGNPKNWQAAFGMIVTLRIIILRNIIMRFLGQDQSFLDPTFIQTYRYYIWTHMWFSNSSLPKKCKLEHPIQIHYIPIYILIHHNSSIFHCIPVKSV